MCHSFILLYILTPQNVYFSNVLEDVDIIGTCINDTRGVVFLVFLQ